MDQCKVGSAGITSGRSYVERKEFLKLKQRIFDAVEIKKERLWEMADFIFDHPEYEGREYLAAKLLTNYLKENGFRVEIGLAGFETAFRAEYKHGIGGPVIGILCEYDALRELGHGCGHHMQGPACLGAAVTLAEMDNDKNYTIVVYGTPAEETLSAKCAMVEAGCFMELDVAFMMHGGPNTCTDVKCMASDVYHVVFYGKRAHAALAPEKGRSALDAFMIAGQGIEFMREHVTEDVKMHYTITELPGPANVVHARTSCTFYIRSFYKKNLDELRERFENVIKGAALITDTTYEIRREKQLFNKIPVLLLNKILMENAELAGAPQLAPPRERTGSTDFGNVMYHIPGSCIRVAFVPEGTSSHSQEFVDAGKSQAAHNCILYGAKAIAGAAWDLISDEALMQQVKNEFKENKKKFN